MRGEDAAAARLTVAAEAAEAAEAERPDDRPAVHPAGIARLLPYVPDGVFTLSAVLTTASTLAWGLYLLSTQHRLLLLYAAAVLGIGALALSCERLGPLAAVDVPRLAARLRRWSWPWAAAPAVLALGLWYRVARWPGLVRAGDSPDYERMASAAAASRQFFLLPWRTPGYAFTLAWTYVLAGIDNTAAVHAWQIGLSLLTALLTMGIAYRVTGSRPMALLALLAGSLLFPLASISAYLMTEVQAVFLATLALFLVLEAHARRHTGAAMLALGPVLALGYETRPALLPLVALLGLAALAAAGARWRQRLVLVAGVLVTLAPAAIVNAQSPYRTVTVGPALDLVSQNLGEDRFSLYWSAPNSPALLDELRHAIVTDGAETEYWLAQRPADMADFSRQRMALMERYVLDHAPAYAELSLRRAPLFYRYDQPTDLLTFSPRHSVPWLLLVDLMVALAIVAVATWTRRGRWPVVALLVGLLVAYTSTLSLFHVEARYGLPVLPVLVVLAVMGVHSLVRMARDAAAPFRPARLAVVAGAAMAVVLAVPASEAWFWPSLVDAYAPRPAPGPHELASCYVGHQLLTSVAWQPGTSFVVAGGANGMAQWTLTSSRCPWQPIQQDNIWDLDFSRDGARLAVGSYNAKVLDTRTWVPLPGPTRADHLSGAGTEILSVSFDPSGGRLAFAATGLHFVGVYDVRGRVVVTTTSRPASPTAVRWSPDGSTVAVAWADGRVDLYDSALRPLGEAVLASEATALAWSPSSRSLAAGDAAGEVRLWDVHGGLPEARAFAPGAHRGPVRSLNFSSDGQSLASAGSDHRVGIWTAEGLQRTRVLTGDTAAVWGVAWSPDSREVVTASADGSLGLWAAR